MGVLAGRKRCLEFAAKAVAKAAAKVVAAAVKAAKAAAATSSAVPVRALAAAMLVATGGMLTLSGCAGLQISGVGSGAGEREDIVVLFTNDVHCGVEDDVGYAGLAAYKELLEAQYEHVALVDCGDAVQGDVIGTVSDGEYIVEIMNEVGYDFAVLGNHEFDYGMEQLSALIDQADAQYLGCNIAYSGSAAGERGALEGVSPYAIVEYGATTVAYVGVITPESVSSSTPSTFMENGQYVYGFMAGDEGAELYACVQGYVDECRAAGADFVVLLTHLGDAEEYSPHSSADVIRNTSGVDAVLDGHAHSVIPGRVVQNAHGEDVLLASTGTKLENIGKLVISASGELSVELVEEYEAKDAEMEAFVDDVQAQYEAELAQVVATSDRALSCSDESGARLVRNRETAIGNFCADAYRAVAGADIAFVNGGGIRADLPVGDITYADMIAVHPFGNTLCMVEASGQEILDCLEVACMDVEAVASEDGVAVGENGSFQQVSGLKFVVDTSVATPVTLDENDALVSIEGKRRVGQVMVAGEGGSWVPLDPKGAYKFASHNYLIKEGGSSYAGFADNVLLIDEGALDYHVLLVYLTEYLDGRLSDRYAATEGRITVL